MREDREIIRRNTQGLLCLRLRKAMLNNRHLCLKKVKNITNLLSLGLKELCIVILLERMLINRIDVGETTLHVELLQHEIQVVLHLRRL